MQDSRQRLQIELGEQESEGIYSNLALITHSPSEFVLDFARVLPGVRKAKVYARIVMTPMHAKGLLKSLSENIERYEGEFGEIKVTQKDDAPGIGFKP
jgi:hypothetical protein